MLEIKIKSGVFKGWGDCIWCGTPYHKETDKCLMKAHKAIEALLGFIEKNHGKGIVRRLRVQMGVK